MIFFRKVLPTLAVVVVIAGVLQSFGCSDHVAVDPDGGADASLKKCGQGEGQCLDGEKCVGGYCMPSWWCLKKADCETVECIDGRCVTPLPDGGDTEEGDTGVSTDGGFCKTDDNCEKGYRCGDDHNCAAAAIIDVNPYELDFGMVPFGMEIERSLTVSNIGKLPLNLEGFVIQNPPENECFRIVSGDTLSTLAENEFQVVSIAYKQNGQEMERGRLIITSNDQKKGIFMVPLGSNYDSPPVFTVYGESGTLMPSEVQLTPDPGCE